MTTIGATEKDVLKATLAGPSGSYPVISATIPRRMGTSHDTASVSVLATSRLRSAMEFDGSFVPTAPGEFARAFLPEPQAGQELRSTGWRLEIEDPAGGKTKVEPLILVEAVVEQANLAGGSQGPLQIDSGQDRQEVWRLSLADSRILWRGNTGIAGKRNYRDHRIAARQHVSEKGEVLTVTAPVVEFERDRIHTKTTSVELHPPDISGSFRPESLLEGRLQSAADLIEEIALRLPLLTRPGRFDPSEMKSLLAKIYPLDIDYGLGTSGAEALERIARAAGLVIGLSLDGRLIVEFDSVPLATQFRRAGLEGRQAKIVREERAYRVSPRASMIRFYPSRVIREVCTGSFYLAAKDTSGKVRPLGQIARELGLHGQESHLAYLMAIKDEKDDSGWKHLGEERMIKGGPPVPRQVLKAPQPGRQPVTTPTELAQRLTYGPRAPTVDIRPRFSEGMRAFFDQIYRGYLYFYDPRITPFAKAARDSLKRRFRDRTREAADTAPPGGRPAWLASVSLAQPKVEIDAMLDLALSTPWKVVRRVEGVPFDLEARFFGDLPLLRAYDFVGMASSIGVSSFEQPPPAPQVGSGFRRDIFIGWLKKTAYLGDGKTLDRRPVDWAESGTTTDLLQSRLKRMLAERNGILPNIMIRGFWEPALAHGYYAAPRELGSLGIIVTWISSDVTAHLKEFDPEVGFVLFDKPLGVFPGSQVGRNFLRGGIKMLAALADKERATLTQQDPRLVPNNYIVIAETIVQHLGLVLADDARHSKVAQRVGAAGLKVDPCQPFSIQVGEFLKRQLAYPLWQVASPGWAVEVQADQPVCMDKYCLEKAIPKIPRPTPTPRAVPTPRVIRERTAPKLPELGPPVPTVSTALEKAKAAGLPLTEPPVAPPPPPDWAAGRTLDVPVGVAP